jgi:thymidylate synthase
MSEYSGKNSKDKKIVSELKNIIKDVKTEDDRRRIILEISELLKVSRMSHYLDGD